MPYLFEPYYFTEQTERLILSYFSDEELQIFSTTNQSWKIRIQKEQRGRQQCVTVMTWPPAEFCSSDYVVIRASGSELKLPPLEMKRRIQGLNGLWVI